MSKIEKIKKYVTKYYCSDCEKYKYCNYTGCFDRLISNEFRESDEEKVRARKIAKEFGPKTKRS